MQRILGLFRKFAILTKEQMVHVQLYQTAPDSMVPNMNILEDFMERMYLLELSRIIKR